MSEQIIEKTKKTWIGMSALLLILMVATIAFGYGYFKLARAFIEMQTVVSSSQANFSALKASVDNVLLAAEKSEALSVKQEQIIADWQAAQKGDLDKWYIAEAHYLVRLANDHLQYSRNTGLALTLLTRAQQVLTQIHAGNLSVIQQALANDIASLQAAQSLDVTKVYLRLTALNSALDQLPLPLDPGHPIPLTQSAVESVASPRSSWWQSALDRVLKGLNKIVIVRENQSKALPITLPEEKLFLYQNLHAQMESAMWALLNQNTAIYQASLSRLTTWIQQYFVSSSPVTITMLQNLQDLRSLNVRPAVSDLQETLQLFDQTHA